MSVDASAHNVPIQQKRLANTTCFNCRQTGHYKKNFLNLTDTGPRLDQIQKHCLTVLQLQ